MMMYLRALLMLFSISLCSSLKCYTCTSSSAMDCKVTQKFEKCNQDENTCLTIHHTSQIYSGNKTKVKSRFLKSCAQSSRNCKVDYCKRFQECKAFCCHEEGCNSFFDPVVASAKHKSFENPVIGTKHTSYGRVLLPFLSGFYLQSFAIFITF